MIIYKLKKYIKKSCNSFIFVLYNHVVFTCGATDNYLRWFRLHGGCGFEYTSGGSCGRACIIPPKSRGHLPPVGQRCLPAVLWVVYLRSSVLAGRCLPAVLISTCGADIYLRCFWDVYLRWCRDVYA